jgi:Tfp pilus assembly protein FimT
MGLSFSEAIVTLSLAGVVAGIGIVSLSSLTASFALDIGSRTVAMALNQARVFAITRGRNVTMTFSTSQFVAHAAGSSEPLVAGDVPEPVTITTTGAATFSPLGTVANPVVVTLDRSGETRLVRVAFSGEVEIE